MRAVALLAVAAVATVAWLAREPLLDRIGGALVVENPVATVDAIVVSNARAGADAIEAAALYRDGVSRRIIVPSWIVEPAQVELVRLGVPFLLPGDLVEAVLVRSDVPREAIERLPDRVDGLSTEVAAVARHVATARIQSLLFVTARTHTARAHWLLSRELPPGTRLLVRSPRLDTFNPHGWWRSRGDSREVAIELLRWANSAILGDRWGSGGE